MPLSLSPPYSRLLKEKFPIERRKVRLKYQKFNEYKSCFTYSLSIPFRCKSFIHQCHWSVIRVSAFHRNWSVRLFEIQIILIEFQKIAVEGQHSVISNIIRCIYIGKFEIKLTSRIFG